MEKYKNIESYLSARNMSREELLEMILEACFNLLNNCEANFEGLPSVTEEVTQPLYYLRDILDYVE